MLRMGKIRRWTFSKNREMIGGGLMVGSKKRRDGC